MQQVNLDAINYIATARTKRRKRRRFWVRVCILLFCIVYGGAVWLEAQGDPSFFNFMWAFLGIAPVWVKGVFMVMGVFVSWVLFWKGLVKGELTNG